MNLLIEPFQYEFFQRAAFAAVLTSIVCGIIGTYVVVKRFASISGGLAHAAFGGIGLGFWLGIEPLAGAFTFCLGCAALMTVIYRRQQQSLDTLIAVIWSVGMALGIILISMTPGYAPNLNNYLFGSILFIPKSYLTLLACIDLLILGSVFLFYKEFQAVSFDEEFCEIVGLPVTAIFLTLLCLTAVVVVTLIVVVGALLTIALLTTPAVISRHWSRSMPRMMVVSIFIALISTFTGLLTSYYCSASNAQLPTGPLIILVVSTIYAISAVLKGFRGRA